MILAPLWSTSCYGHELFFLWFVSITLVSSFQSRLIICKVVIWSFSYGCINYIDYGRLCTSHWKDWACWINGPSYFVLHRSGHGIPYLPSFSSLCCLSWIDGTLTIFWLDLSLKFLVAQIRKAIADAQSGNVIAFATGKVKYVLSGNNFIFYIFSCDFACFPICFLPVHS